MSKALFPVLLAGVVFGVAGCVTLTGGKAEPAVTKPQDPRLDVIATLLDEERYNEAMLRCIDVARIEPDLPGLAELQARVINALTIRQGELNALTSETSRGRTIEDVDTHNQVPNTWNTVRMIQGENSPLRTPTTAMQQELERRVSVHLDQPVGLNEFVRQISQSQNINMIVDGAIDSEAQLQIEVTDTPLSELLDYAARNFGVAFYLGRNVIWVTPRDDTEPPTPMETRIYRLRRGLSGDEVLAGGDINIMTAVNRFVPVVAGSDILFDTKAHVLIVKNTRENLEKVEDIVEALDVCPPQVLIEARFISAEVSDLRELGIDWIMDSSLAVTKNTVIRGGSPVDVPRSVIDAGAGVTHPEFTQGTTGLNLTYRGLLTEPMFNAVVHALETSGKSRTLSVPKVTTVNNKMARVRIGDDFRYFEEYETVQVGSVLTDSVSSPIYRTLPTGSPTLEELGYELKVTPSVGADLATVTLALVPEISEFVDWEYWEVSGGNGNNNNNNNNGSTVTNAEVSTMKLPIFRRSTIETEVIVRSGETVVMGGLIHSTETRDRSGVPILSSLPFIGSLFQHVNIDERKQNLLVFVTATIISDRGKSLLPMQVGTLPPADRPAVAAAPVGGGMGGPPAFMGGSAEAGPASSNTAMLSGVLEVSAFGDAVPGLEVTLPDGRLLTWDTLSQAGPAGYCGPVDALKVSLCKGASPQTLFADGAPVSVVAEQTQEIRSGSIMVNLVPDGTPSEARWMLSVAGTDVEFTTPGVE